MLESMTCEAFARHLHEEFSVQVDEETAFAMELVKAAEWGAAPAVEGGRLPFTITFRGPGHVILPQRIYRMTHPEMGTFELFVVPISQDTDGVRYEAVFT
jgi:hypothetical protein